MRSGVVAIALVLAAAVARAEDPSPLLRFAPFALAGERVVDAFGDGGGIRLGRLAARDATGFGIHQNLSLGVTMARWSATATGDLVGSDTGAFSPGVSGTSASSNGFVAAGYTAGELDVQAGLLTRRLSGARTYDVVADGRLFGQRLAIFTGLDARRLGIELDVSPFESQARELRTSYGLPTLRLEGWSGGASPYVRPPSADVDLGVRYEAPILDFAKQLHGSAEVLAGYAGTGVGLRRARVRGNWSNGDGILRKQHLLFDVGGELGLIRLDDILTTSWAASARVTGLHSGSFALAGAWYLELRASMNAFSGIDTEPVVDAATLGFVIGYQLLADEVASNARDGRYLSGERASHPRPGPLDRFATLGTAPAPTQPVPERVAPARRPVAEHAVRLGECREPPPVRATPNGVADTTPPRIPCPAPRWEDGRVTFDLEIEDESGIFGLQVHWRQSGETEYRTLDFNKLKARVQIDTIDDFELWIEAYDELGNGPSTLGSATAPVRIELNEVKEEALPLD